MSVSHGELAVTTCCGVPYLELLQRTTTGVIHSALVRSPDNLAHLAKCWNACRSMAKPELLKPFLENIGTLLLAIESGDSAYIAEAKAAVEAVADQLYDVSKR